MSQTTGDFSDVGWLALISALVASVAMLLLVALGGGAGVLP